MRPSVQEIESDGATLVARVGMKLRLMDDLNNHFRLFMIIFRVKFEWVLGRYPTRKNRPQYLTG